MNSKRGMGRGNGLLIAIIIILSIIVIYLYNSSINLQSANQDQQKQIDDLNAKLGIKNANGLVNKIELGAAFYFGKAAYYTKGLLGFKDNGFILTTWDFITDYWLGFSAGLILWLTNMLIMFWANFGSRFEMKNTLVEIGKHRESWLFAVAGSAWKIFAIGLFYAIVMQIPIVNRFFDIITFKVLEVNPLIRTAIFAFYIGFGPALLEWGWRYRLRKKYYKQLMSVKYGVKVAKAMSSG